MRNLVQVTEWVDDIEEIEFAAEHLERNGVAALWRTKFRGSTDIIQVAIYRTRQSMGGDQ